MDKIIEAIIEPDNNKIRIDRYLADNFQYFSRSAWQNQIIAGKLTLNEEIVTNANKKVKTGDKLCFYGKKRPEPDVDNNYSIIFEDQYLIGINKTGDLPVHPAGIYLNNTLSVMLEKQFKQKIFLIHRLDRETSGVIIAAKSSETAAIMQKSLHQAQKIYLAICKGIAPELFTEKTPLGQDPNSNVRKKRLAFDEASESAETHFKLIESINNYSIIEAQPKTGRLHQIRAHLEHAGYPIIGDKLYGGNPDLYLKFIKSGMTQELKQKLQLSRCALHAEKLTFMHPYTKKTLTLSAPLQNDMQKFIDRIKK